MPVFSREYLCEVGAALFAAAGVPTSSAEVVADLLADANAVGHDSHGVIRIPQYIRTIEKGEIVPEAQVEIVRETAVSAVMDGHWGFGQVVMDRAVVWGMERAGRYGVAAVTVQRANHIGRLGSYVERIAAGGMIGLLFANSHGGGAIVGPWGGKEGRLGTNPLAAGLPRAEGGRLVLDMTTSVVAEGKVRIKRNRGEKVPEGWIVDAEGNPSTDPRDFYGEPRGSLLPFGGTMGHKGYGLGVIVELLGGALSGAGCAKGREARNGNGSFLLVIDIGRFQPFDEYCRQVEDFAAYLKASPKAAGFADILMPGELEERERIRRREGIFVEEQTWAQILDCGRRIGASLPEPEV
jgi:uncharacterized oxidoreductase